MLFYSQETGGAGTEDRTGDVYEKKYSCFCYCSPVHVPEVRERRCQLKMSPKTLETGLV